MNKKHPASTPNTQTIETEKTMNQSNKPTAQELLDQSANYDATTSAKLRAIREIAVEGKHKRSFKRPWFIVAVPAFAMLAWLPFSPMSPWQSTTTAEQEQLVKEGMEDIEFYQDLEFYLWLDENDEQSL